MNTQYLATKIREGYAEPMGIKSSMEDVFSYVTTAMGLHNNRDEAVAAARADDRIGAGLDSVGEWEAWGIDNQRYVAACIALIALHRENLYAPSTEQTIRNADRILYSLGYPPGVRDPIDHGREYGWVR